MICGKEFVDYAVNRDPTFDCCNLQYQASSSPAVDIFLSAFSILAFHVFPSSI